MVNRLTPKGSKNVWYPPRIKALENYLSVLLQENTYFTKSQISSLKKNIAYNLQYVEFLTRIMKDIQLSDVLITQNIKFFVICSASIIEALFYYIVISNGKGSTTNWVSYKNLGSHEFSVKEDKFKTETELFIKVPHPIDKDMTFDQMCKKIEDRKMLGDVKDLYKQISNIRKLRNRIHIQEIKHSTDTDWWIFNQDQFKLMKKVLYGVLTSSLFSNSSQHSFFDYLK